MSNIATRSLCVCVLLLACVSLAAAQGREVSGTVTDASSGLPLPGVNIVLQGTTTGTTTDIDGQYRLQVPGNDAVLVYSFVGYLPQEITVGDQQVIDVMLEENVAELEDVVVVGYGTQRKADVTGSVSSISADDARLGLITSPDQMIQGRVAGVTITRNNGEPGSGFAVRIRGGTSISASNEPLYVIDGVPVNNVRTEPTGANVTATPGRNPLNMINPNDIQSIDILKDASATAIYGSRAANGVILITTKQGSAGQVTVDYEGYVAASRASKKLDVLSAAEYKAFIQQEIDNGNLDAAALNNLGTADTDWQDALLRTGYSQFHNLAIGGGATNTQYRASLSYLDQKGQVISSGLERLTGRLNANHTTLNDRLKLGLNLTSAYVTDDYLPYNQYAGFSGGLFLNMISFNPTRPVKNADGSYYEVGAGSQDVRNPVALAEQVSDFGKTTRTLGNIQAQLDLFAGLSAQVNVGLDRAQASRRSYYPKASPVGAQYNGQAIQKNREHSSATFTSYLTYRPELPGSQNLDLLAGYEYTESMIEEFGVEARNFVTDFWRYNNLSGGLDLIKGSCSDASGTYSCKETNRLVSFFGRANYDWKGRYLFSASLRRDGSSRFGADHKWGLFPALSFGWRLSDEPFMQGIDAISDMKLRVGYGVNGSQEIGNYASLALLAPDAGSRAVLGGQPVTGVAPITYANPDLQWEETRSFNVGLDYALLSGRFSGTLEYYVKNTDNLLLDVTVPQPAVVDSRLENIGEIQNRGLEFSLDALAIDKPDLSMLVGFVFATEHNEVVSLGDREQIITGEIRGRGQSGQQSQIITPGEPVPSFYGLIFDGVVDGVQTFRDLNGDGQINSDDRAIIGNPRPAFTYGFNGQLYWNRFDVRFSLRGVQGSDIVNNLALVYQNKSGAKQNSNVLAAALEDPDGFNEPARFSSRWVEDGSFLRLQNVTVGYTVDASQLTSQLRNARIYLSADNVLTLTGYSGFDPEITSPLQGLAAMGIDWMNYPAARTFTVGVNLGF